MNFTEAFNFLKSADQVLKMRAYRNGIVYEIKAITQSGSKLGYYRVSALPLNRPAKPAWYDAEDFNYVWGN